MLFDGIVQLSTLIAIKLVESLNKTVVVFHNCISLCQVKAFELIQVLLQHLQDVLLDRCWQLLVELGPVEQGFKHIFVMAQILTHGVQLLRVKG